jgi:hypothetical protein
LRCDKKALSEAGDDDSQREDALWGPVNPDIWAPRPRKGRLQRIGTRVLETVSSVSVVAFAIVGPAAFLASLLLVYYVAGPALFGPALLTFWAIVIIGFVLALEKSGYARNFENWGFRLTPAKMIALPASFVIIVGVFYLFLFFARLH